MGRLEGWKVGKLGSWKVGRLKIEKAGKREDIRWKKCPVL